jgi:hypothetical protein
MGGTKNDKDKVDLSLVPLPAIEAMGRALMFGAAKYGRYNYTLGFETHRLIAACLRHLGAWQEGEDLDPESGLSHLDHAITCLAMLVHCQKLKTAKDTRRKTVVHE